MLLMDLENLFYPIIVDVTLRKMFNQNVEKYIIVPMVCNRQRKVQIIAMKPREQGLIKFRLTPNLFGCAQKNTIKAGYLTSIFFHGVNQEMLFGSFPELIVLDDI